VILYLSQLPIVEQSFVFTPPWFWLSLGLILIIFDLFFLRKIPNKFKFIVLSLGAGALLISLILWYAGRLVLLEWRYTMYDNFGAQIFNWLGDSLAFIIWLRPTLIKRPKFEIKSSEEGTTLTEILPGKTGRILYEGTSWQGKCSDPQQQIKADQKVYILSREGNTLIVADEDFFNSNL